MNTTVPSGGLGQSPRAHAPGARIRSPFYSDNNEAPFRTFGGLDALVPSVHELLRSPTRPIGPALARALHDLAENYVPAQGLGGSLHFDQAMPDLDVAEAPMHAILEHLVEGSLRGNPSIKPYCHVSVVQDTQEKVVLAVRDNGTPLPECGMEDLRAFLRDTQARHVPDRVHRLFLADNLVQWLGGRLSIAPTPGADGTTVLVEIPRTTKDDAHAQSLVGRHVF